MGLGVYSDIELIEFVKREIILPQTRIQGSQVQPSSLDLRLGNEAYCMNCSSIPRTSIAKHIRENKQYKFSLDRKDGGFLHKEVVYLIELDEALNLPDYMAAKSNPKSSIGRIDTHVRLVTEKGDSFDEVRNGYKGRLFLEVFPRSFDLRLWEGESLNQIRFRDYSYQPLTAEQIISIDELSEEGLLKGDKDKRLSVKGRLFKNSLSLTANLTQNPAAYIARKDAPPIDFRRRDLPFSQYFNPVKANNSSIIIDRDSFYLLSTKEFFITPEDHCVEMADIDTISGEYRAHYAGFFDPGFRGEAVLEVRNMGPPFKIVDGQKIANMIFYQMKETPQKMYGSAGKSNYQGQIGIRAAKFFDMSK